MSRSTPELAARMPTARRPRAWAAIELDAPIEGEVALPEVRKLCCNATAGGLAGHPLLLDQLDTLIAAAGRARQSDPVGWHGNANDQAAGLLARSDARAGATQPARGRVPAGGNTLGPARHRHWFRVTFGANWFRLFFRPDSALRLVVYAWVTDRDTLRQCRRRKQSLRGVAPVCWLHGNPSDDWPEAARRCAGPGGDAALRGGHALKP